MGTFMLLVIAATGYDAMARLNFGFGARELAMGGAATANCNSAAAALWNPGALASLGTGSFSVYSPFCPVGRFHESGDGEVFAAWAQPIGKTACLGLAADRLNLGGIECRETETKGCDSLIGYSETSVWLCGALGVLPGLKAGSGLALHVRELGNGEHGWSGTTATWSFGLDFIPFRWLRAGLSARMFPEFLTAIGTDDYVNPRVAAGLTFVPARNLILSSDVVKRLDRDVQVNLGAEYRHLFQAPWEDSERKPLNAAIRLGLKEFTPAFGARGEDGDWVGPVQPGAPTAGLGFEYIRGGLRFGLDYAWVIGHGALGDYHAVSFTVGY